MDAVWLIVFSVLCLTIAVKLWTVLRRRPRTFTLGFFHPYADAGGGGERVLWHSMDAILSRNRSMKCLVWTGERDRTKDQILDKVKARFGLDLPRTRVTFVFLRLRWLVEASTWPRLTLVCQCLGSVILGLEALIKYRPHVYFDSMGYAFTYPLFRWLGGMPIFAYVHYPVVSTDMLSLVASGQKSYNNVGMISRSRVLTRLKLVYYRLLARMYGFVGRRATVVMVNSTWTKNHISEIWHPNSLTIVYPSLRL